MAEVDELDLAIAEFLEADANGTPADRSSLVSRYPSAAAELESFFCDHDRMQRISAPLRGLVANKTATSRSSQTDPTLPPSSRQLTPEDFRNERIGRYELKRELGRGGMGVVYEARDTQLNRTVALKMIPAGRFASEADLERFRIEAQLAASLTHPNIVPIFEADQWRGLPFFAMRLVEGVSLAELIQEGPMAPIQAARLLKKIASAVTFAHAHGVIHRDLKPANILLSRNDQDGSGRGEQHDAFEPAISDFGLAKRLDLDDHLTTTGQVLGTPAYMPPEQASGNRHEIGEATDIYALGAILYAMLTGRPPFQAESPVEIILQVLENDPPSPRQLNPAIPQELEAICLKCLEKRPERRYISAQALAIDIERFLKHEPPEAGQGSLLRTVRRWGRREPVAAWHLGGLAFIVVLVQVIFALHPERELIYHLQVCAPLVGWLLSCCMLMQISRDDRWRDIVPYLWSAVDAIFLTATLASLESPIPILLSSYLILICAAGLFFRTRLVVFTTIAAVATSITLLVNKPEAAHPLHHAVLYEAILAIAGFVVGYQVWRFGVLREYYEERR